MSKVFGTEAFTKEILKAIDCLTAAGETISLDNITEQLTDYIVDNYDGKTSLYVYKDLWNTHVENFLNSFKITYPRGPTDWENIAFLLVDKHVRNTTSLPTN